MTEKDKRKKPPQKSTAGNPMWLEIRAAIDAELILRGEGLSFLTKADKELQWSTMYTAMRKSENAQWDTVQRIIRALGWTLADLTAKVAEKPKKPRKAKAA